MVCKAKCAVAHGLEVSLITVECDMSNGIPGFDMVGLLASEIKESSRRVRTAIKNSGYMIPPKKITVNFSPAAIRKSGTGVDLALAVSVLKAMEIISEDISDALFLGELGLDGRVISVSGVLPIVMEAMSRGIKKCFIPSDNLGECDFISDLEIVGVDSINDLLKILEMGDEPLNQVKHIRHNEDYKYDFKDIRGQDNAKRVALISACGMHNLMLEGEPGSGKSVVAKAMPSILPSLSFEEKIEISKIYSISGLLDGGLIENRPYVEVNNSVTLPSLLGAGRDPKPGLISLAHRGVLFLDEFPELKRDILESLRAPMEDGSVTISRMGGSYVFPAKFVMLSAMNPCPCGYYPNRKRCKCSEHEIKKYRGKISGPIIDRIDLWVRVEPLKYDNLVTEEKTMDSKDMKAEVERVLAIQRSRFKDDDISFNSEIELNQIDKYCPMEVEARELLKRCYSNMNMSVRGYLKVVRVARTIADLDREDMIKNKHIAEAIRYRAEV